MNRPSTRWVWQRLWLERWRRLTRWEFWPAWIVYPPVVLYVLWLAIRHRGLHVFAACNPAIPGGGFIGAGQPVGAVHKQKVDMVDAHQAQAFFRAFHEARGLGVVKGGPAFRMKLTGDVDAAFGDDLDLALQTRIQ